MTISQQKIVAKDYFDDEEFAALYTYLRNGQLTGDSDKDRKLLLQKMIYYTKLLCRADAKKCVCDPRIISFVFRKLTARV